jgi:hypothetical protein
MRPRTAVIFDLDSTTRDTRHRWHLAPVAPDTDWDPYALACADDLPIAGTITLARLLYPYHQVHFCSGSNEVSRGATLEWLCKHQVPHDALYQRPRWDHRPNLEVKVDYIRYLRSMGIEPALFVEDHPDVKAAIEEQAGVPVLGVNPFYPTDRSKLGHITPLGEAL